MLDHNTPRKDFLLFNSPFQLKLTRAGKKTSDLLILIKYLITTQNPMIFVDVFGGTGSVSTAVSDYFEKIELNEFDSYLFNLIKCIRDNPQLVLKICRNMCNKIRDFEYTKDCKIDERIDGYYYHSDNCKKCLGPILSFYNYLYEKYEALNITSEEYAAILYFLMSFKAKVNATDYGITGVSIETYIDFLDKLSLNNKKTSSAMLFNKYFIEYITPKEVSPIKPLFSKPKDSEIFKFSSRLKNVLISNLDFNVFYKDIKNKYNNPEDIVWYFDPPYFMTAQYKDAFSDEQHVELINILKDISNSGGKWAFSCKDKITNKSQKEMPKGISYRHGQDGKGAIISSFKNYFKGFQAEYTFIKKDNIFEVTPIPESEYTKKHKLFVYKLKKEKNDEIVITNFRHLETAPIIINNIVNLKGVPDFNVEDFKAFLNRL